MRAGRHRERQSSTAIERREVGIAKRHTGRSTLDREEIGKVVIRIDVLEPLNGAFLHRQQYRLPTHWRVETQGLFGNDTTLDENIAGTVDNILWRRQIANPPSRLTQAGQANPLTLAQAFGITRITVGFTDRLREISRALHRTADHRQHDLCTTTTIEQRLRQGETISAEPIDFRIVDKTQHLLKAHTKGHRVISKPPTRLRKFLFGSLIGKLDASAQRTDFTAGLLIALKDYLLPGRQRISPLIIGVILNLLDKNPQRTISWIARISRTTTAATNGR